MASGRGGLNLWKHILVLEKYYKHIEAGSEDTLNALHSIWHFCQEMKLCNINIRSSFCKTVSCQYLFFTYRSSVKEFVESN